MEQRESISNCRGRQEEAGRDVINAKQQTKFSSMRRYFSIYTKQRERAVLEWHWIRENLSGIAERDPKKSAEMQQM